MMDGLHSISKSSAVAVADTLGAHAPVSPPPAGRGSSIRLPSAFCVTPPSVTLFTVMSPPVALVNRSSILASMRTTQRLTSVVLPVTLISCTLLMGMPPSGRLAELPLTVKTASAGLNASPSAASPNTCAGSILANE